MSRYKTDSDRAANAAHQRRWYAGNKSKKKAIGRNYKHEQVAKAARYKLERGCSTCGYNGCASALEFHHLDASVKEGMVSAMLWKRSFESVLLEIDKCVILCANCHREYHEGIITLR